jgi:hypothetical protein
MVIKLYIDDSIYDLPDVSFFQKLYYEKSKTIDYMLYCCGSPLRKKIAELIKQVSEERTEIHLTLKDEY